MLALFRSTQAYAGLPFLLYALLLQLPVFIGGGAVPVVGEQYGMVGRYVAEWSAAHPWLAAVLPVVLLSILGLQASSLANRHHYTRSPIQFAALGVMLAWGLIPGARLLHPTLLANCFLLFALLSISRVYKADAPQIHVFNAGAWVAVAALFYPAYLLFLFPLSLAASMLYRGGLFQWLRLLTGVVLVFLLAGSLAYFRGSFATFYALQWPVYRFEWIAADQLSLGLLGVMGVILLLVLVRQGDMKRVINIEGSKGIDIQFWVLFFTPALVLLSGPISVTDAAVLVVPAGILFGLFLNTLSPRVAELAHMLVLAAALVVGAMPLLPAI